MEFSKKYYAFTYLFVVTNPHIHSSVSFQTVLFLIYRNAQFNVTGLLYAQLGHREIALVFC